jgi:Carboxypeptidase regulatory-like domain
VSHTNSQRRCVFALVAMTILGVVSARPVWAQQASGIAGTVRDSAGLAMPGVTVEAASPALIEKVRSVVTDGEGRYSIVDLRVGTYTVTFTLPGFSSVKREGVALTSGFTASVNVTMAVGAIEETITVSGAAPVVDTQTVRQQETMNTRELESLPSGSIGLQTLAYVTPGFATTQADVGGTRDTWSAQGAYTFFHGKTGTRASFDGFRNQYFIGAASGVGYITDQGMIEELQLETSGMGAESGSGSTSLNAIPKSGSNNFRGGLDGFFSNAAMQATNIDDNLRSFGITSSAEVQRIYRVGGQVGGPIKRDRVWFFGAIGRWGTRVNQPGAFYNSLQGKSGVAGTPTLFYPGQPGTPFASTAPDTSRPAASFDWFRNHALRTTVNVTSKQRVNFYFDIQKSCRCTTGPFTGANAIESERGWDWWPSGVVQGTWTMPVTSRLLLEAGASWQVANWINFAEDGVSRDDRSILETATNYRYGATSILTAPKARTGRSAQRFSLTYVTGTHNIKVGITDEQAFNDESRTRNNQTDGLNFDFFNGRPIRLQYYAQPFLQQERQNAEIGLFAQDAWKIQRMTLSLGLRWDYLTMGYPEADLPAGPFVPARHVDELSGIPTWSDINPRLGISYDVFGNGRTAVKASLGRYNQLSRSDLTRRFHPFSSSVNAAFRNWTDSNNNFIPDCNLADFSRQDRSASGGDICDVISNTNFGKFIPSAISYDDSVTKNNRDFLWDINVEAEHEIMTGLSVNVGYNHNWDGNFTITDDPRVTSANFDEFCVTVPNDSRLPNAGQQQCGYYDIQSAYFPLGNLRVTNAKEYGTLQRYWDGVWVGANGRLPYGIQLGGGIDTGRQVDDHCVTVDIPNQPNDIGNVPMTFANQAASLAGAISPFCHVVSSWMDLMDFRLRGSVPFKGGFNASFIFRNTPGAEQSAVMTVTSSQVAFKNPARTTLTTAKTVYLYAPNSVFGDRFNQLDLAVNKSFTVPFGRVRLALDLYNVLNSNSIQQVNTAYALTNNRWLRPTGFLDPRLARVTAGFSF